MALRVLSAKEQNDITMSMRYPYSAPADYGSHELGFSDYSMTSLVIFTIPIYEPGLFQYQKAIDCLIRYDT